MNTFEELLEEKLEELNNINNINRGGCGFVAYGLKKFIEANVKGSAPKVVYLFDVWDYDYDELKANNNGSCSHAILKFNGKYYDSKGEFSEEELKYYRTLTLPTYLVERSIKEYSHWNRSFNRERVKDIDNILRLNGELSKLAA